MVLNRDVLIHYNRVLLNIYNNYEYEYNEYPKYNEEYKNIYHSTLIQCADVLKSRFSDIFYKYINDLEGGDLSGAETDEEEE